MQLEAGRDVLLFFQDRDPDTFVRGDRHLRRRLRKATEFLRPGRQQVSGFELSFRLLCTALERAGARVHVNAYALARRNPHFPVGICGYPHILDTWSLPNPAVLGPGLFDHPKQAPALMTDPRFRFYIAFCDWMNDLFATVYPRASLVHWFGAIDLDRWDDTRHASKDIDVLVYDKIRWRRDELVPALRDPIIADLEARGLRYEMVSYGRYTHDGYEAQLRRSRSLLFLCEHETQGMAYQEAMASNVPVIAWDNGFWLDPNRTQWEDRPVPASSVPYFDATCGERFADLAEFRPAFDRFWANLEAYEPRAWVAHHLSFAESARRYLEAYVRAEKPAASAV